MDLRQMEVVIAVAEEGGFSAAARRLHVVQSAISSTVRALERELGAPLFHRTTHRVSLTPCGTRLPARPPAPPWRPLKRPVPPSTSRRASCAARSRSA